MPVRFQRFSSVCFWEFHNSLIPGSTHWALCRSSAYIFNRPASPPLASGLSVTSFSRSVFLILGVLALFHPLRRCWSRSTRSASHSSPLLTIRSFLGCPWFIHNFTVLTLTLFTLGPSQWLLPLGVDPHFHCFGGACYSVAPVLRMDGTALALWVHSPPVLYIPLSLHSVCFYGLLNGFSTLSSVDRELTDNRTPPTVTRKARNFQTVLCTATGSSSLSVLSAYL